MIAKNVGYLNDNQYNDMINKLMSIERQLNGLLTSVRKSQG